MREFTKPQPDSFLAAALVLVRRGKEARAVRRRLGNLSRKALARAMSVLRDIPMADSGEEASGSPAFAPYFPRSSEGAGPLCAAARFERSKFRAQIFVGNPRTQIWANALDGRVLLWGRNPLQPEPFGHSGAARSNSPGGGGNPRQAMVPWIWQS
jgi:hypothetical protein